MFGVRSATDQEEQTFTFSSVEYWKVGFPNSYIRTVPTAAEAAGDFSQTKNIDGSLRTVYDPFSTQFNAATGAVTRTPFAGNVVPSNRFDPLAASLMKQFWAPNNLGDNITGVNNFRKVSSRTTTTHAPSRRLQYQR